MPGIRIYPGRVVQKTSYRDSQLDQLREAADRERQALSLVKENSAMLSGEAWNSAVRYIDEVQQPLLNTAILWIDEQKKGNGIYKRAAECLPGVNCLDEEQLKRQREHWERCYDREWSEEEPSHWMLSFYRRMIRNMNEKLEAVYDFVRTTNPAYAGAKALQSFLEKAADQLGRVVYYPKINYLDFTNLDREWFLRIGEDAIKQFFLGEGVTAEGLENREFSLLELKRMYDKFNTAEDRRLFAELLNGNERKAFQINPSRLSEAGILFIVKYTERLLEKDDMEKLQHLINEMLYTDANHSNYPGYVYGDTKAFGMDYLERLSVESSYFMDREGEMMVKGRRRMSDEEMETAGGELVLMRDLNALWGSLGKVGFDFNYMERSGIVTNPMQLIYGGQVMNLEHRGAGFEYQYQYSTARLESPQLEAAGKNITKIEWSPEGILAVNTFGYDNLNEMDAQEYRERLQEIRKKQERLWVKHAGKATTEVIGAFYPKVGKFMNLLVGLSEGDMEEAAKSGIKLLKDEKYEDQLEKTWELEKGTIEKYSKGALAGLGVFGEWTDYQKEKKELLKELEQESAYQKIKWFGSITGFEAGGVTMTTNMGYYNPRAIMDVKKWEEEGMDYVLNKEVEKDKVRATVINNIAKQLAGLEVTLEGDEKGPTIRPAMGGYLEDRLIDSRLTEEQKILLYGGGDILAMNTEMFVHTVQDINDAYKSIYYMNDNAPFGPNLNLQAIFQMD